MSHSASGTSSPHPMTDVPDAIRIVLQETARLVLTQPRPCIHHDVQIQGQDHHDNLLHSVLAEPVLMQEPGYPPYRASIMDGYAIRVAEYRPRHQEERPSTLTLPPNTHAIVDKIFAGDTQTQKTLEFKYTQGLPPAYYVTTGAVIPDSFDCVVPVENCVVDDAHQFLSLAPTATVAIDKWIRPVGSDIPAGTEVLPKGNFLDPVALGLIRQSGCESVYVRRPVRVGVLSTGNELWPQQSTCDKQKNQQGLIPDVNRPVLMALLKGFGNCTCIDLGVARDDDANALTRILQDQLEHCDVILTTGGISMGESDIVEDVLVNMLGGTLHFGRLNMKPGKPTTFVVLPSDHGQRLVFAMPGNPVSAIVCTQLLVRPCLDMLFSADTTKNVESGGELPERIQNMVESARVHAELQATLSHDIKLDQGRPEYHRVVLSTRSTNEFIATSTGVQQSSRLMSMRDADGLMVLPKGTSVKDMALAGERYTVLLLRDIPMVQATTVNESTHLSRRTNQRPLLVGVVKTDEPATSGRSVEDRVVAALSGAESGPVALQSSRVFNESCCDQLYDFLQNDTSVDIHVVVSSKYTGPHLAPHLAMASHLRSRLSKVADAMALQARLGARSQDPGAALFETVVGFIPERHGSLVITIPEQGLEGALGNVRVLLKHALAIARSGGPHSG